MQEDSSPWGYNMFPEDSSYGNDNPVLPGVGGGPCTFPDSPERNPLGDCKSEAGGTMERAENGGTDRDRMVG